MWTLPAQPRRTLAAMSLAVMAISLTGCVDNNGDLVASAPSSNASRIAARPGVSPAGATVAFVTVEGAPPAIIARFADKTVAEATRRRVTVADAANARYLVRGYLSSVAIEGGASIGYVWDVFDSSRRRVQRTEDAIVVRGSAPDPWSLASDQALTSLAAKSADDLAAILSNMPEAIAAASPAAAAIAANAPAMPAPQAPPGLSAYR